jgi:hypothetical protein
MKRDKRGTVFFFFFIRRKISRLKLPPNRAKRQFLVIWQYAREEKCEKETPHPRSPAIESISTITSPEKKGRQWAATKDS